MPRENRYPAVLDQLLTLVVMVNDDMTLSLARRGLTVSRAGVLWQLRHRGPCTGRSLADALGVSARTITGLVDGLVATGHVTRQPHPSDRRAALVTFTDRGSRAVRTLEHEQREFTQLLFDGLSDTEFDGLADGLGHLVKQIREHLPPVPASRESR
jgi:DNA-binding MarR family transcriptional regulator